MRYKKTVEGRFIERPNRFVAYVDIGGKKEVVHVKNTGRCKELLLNGSRVVLCESDNLERKTKYDLISIEKMCQDGQCRLINIDSQAPNQVAFEWIEKSGLFSQNASVRREVKYGNSRFDLYIEDGNRKAFMEVKGVTLEFDGKAKFPDAPTERGVKHLLELEKCLNDGFEAYILFVIQMKGVVSFSPNDEMHKEFGETLRRVSQKGVKLLAYDCIITEDSMEIDNKIEIKL